MDHDSVRHSITDPVQLIIHSMRCDERRAPSPDADGNNADRFDPITMKNQLDTYSRGCFGPGRASLSRANAILRAPLRASRLAMMILTWSFSLSSLLGLSTEARAADPIRVACIGDSITEGAGVDNATVNAYPIVLGRLLGTNYQTRNFGVGGRTLLRKGDYPYWKEAAFKNATNYAPRIVTIKLGTNDSKYYNWAYKDDFAQDLRDMIDIFAALPSKPRIVVCLPVPAYYLNFDINPEVIRNEIIPILKRVAAEKGATVVDLYNPLSGRPELFPDGIHPNAAGAALIAKTLHGALLSLPLD